MLLQQFLKVPHLQQHPARQQAVTKHASRGQDTARRVCSDAGLAAERKAYLMQNIMASRYIVAQQRRLAGAEAQGSGSAGAPARSFHDAKRGVLGCTHYRRKCVLLLIPLQQLSESQKIASVQEGMHNSPFSCLLQ